MLSHSWVFQLPCGVGRTVIRDFILSQQFENGVLRFIWGHLDLFSLSQRKSNPWERQLAYLLSFGEGRIREEAKLSIQQPVDRRLTVFHVPSCLVTTSNTWRVGSANNPLHWHWALVFTELFHFILTTAQRGPCSYNHSRLRGGAVEEGRWRALP